MATRETSYKRKKTVADRFTETVFSWSLEDVFNENLFKDKVEKIPESFQSAKHYLGSYGNPLLEETRAELQSSMEVLYNAPFAEVISSKEAKPYGTKVYQVRVDHWRNKSRSGWGKEPYKTLPGDTFVLAHCKPETVSDIQRAGNSWAFLSLIDIRGDGSTDFKVKASKEFGNNTKKNTSLYIIFLVNLIPQKRIWEALHISSNLQIINETLGNNSAVKKKCDGCSKKNYGIGEEKMVKSLSSKLNESQTGAVLSCLHMMKCMKKSAVELIWGPPGTGKTKTTSTLLVTLLRRNHKILVCAPTNVAITELASRVLKLVLDVQADPSFCSLGDILLFGTKERLNIGSDIEEIYLDFRVQQLAECFGPLGWSHCFTNMIYFLANCVSEYQNFLENESTKEGAESSASQIKEKGCISKSKVGKDKFKSFLKFVRERFVFTFSELKRCISIICTHTTKCYILKKNSKSMASLIGLLDSFQSLLSQHDVVSEELQELFSHSEVVGDLSHSFGDKTSFSLFKKRNECLSSLKTLHGSLKELDMSSFKSEKAIKKFCFERASLIFCTVSSSFKLHNLKIQPTILVIDEAAQLKECESTIPLQLPGLRHAILVGDEWQLPATVKSKVSVEAGFGRSLFERLSSQNHKRHLLNVQYRMHPSISLFPNSEFYHNQIRDAAIVKSESYEKKYLPGSMFGPYSFINIIGGKEERDEDGRSRKNMVEVAVIVKILQNLYKAWLKSQHELSIGIVSPYAAQVVAVQEKLGKKYHKISGFQVKVKTVDGFQGGEEDIIIMSTVCSSGCHSLDFVSNPQRTNVALTRARHCLWILGNERILANSRSVWSAIIIDAKNRGCFFNADHDGDLANSITEVKKEFGQFDDLLNPDSILFKSSKWKVLFSDSFLKSLRKLASIDTKKSVINLLLKLSDGWRPRRHVVEFCESPLQIKNFKVVGLCVVCTVDISLTDSGHMQVLKIWDILPPENISEFIKGLSSTFEKYSEAFINLCNEKCSEGKIEIPKIWPPSLEIVRFKDLSMNETGSDPVGVVSDGRCYVENSSVSNSSLPMKFYSLSNCVVNHILSGRDARELDLPFEVPDQEKEIILFHRSAFVLGQSGTGKTTVLTMKLFQKEYLHHLTMEGLYGAKSNVLGLVNQSTVVEKKPEKTTGNVLRQLFVTTSPKLCNAVKQHLSYLRSFSCSGSQSSEDSPIHMDDNDAEETILKNIPDSFHGIPASCYPLVITFEKFLVMLDGTLSNSYFERLINTTELSQSQVCASRSHARRSFVRTKEVNYERFCSQYWPHFNSHVTKKLDPSRVFTEIISLIKGGVQSMEASDGKLTREDYVVLSEECASGLISRKKRGRIYDLFMIYENMKMEKGEFDLADYVNDLHCRLKREKYQGDGMDFVYVDEVQELTMSQVALFRHVCSNVEEGFVFSGDTLQTIANFRIKDIRSLFDKKFVLEPKREHKERKASGRMPNIFHLTQNFQSHAGILKLSQSIIELLYHFFPLSIDIMEPGTTTVIGETPLLLESWNNENAVFSLFGKSETKSRNVIGFGSQQVILVRDESARRKIKDCVGKQALILTIMECKDLEFQDVLLYHFFGSSPLGKQWSVTYKYMKEQDLSIDMSRSFPHFDESKHEILLSELKQLYVAVASTKQRLWICDDTELSKPMFDYWKKKLLVQERVLDDHLAQAMQLSSSPEEWRSRGIEFYYKHNHEMATICFEKAGDTFWEKKSKAAGLEAMADRMRSSNPEEANSALREAAEIFNAIDKADSAARCFYDSGEYERAGRIYLEIFGDTELQRAGECFYLAGNYKFAANVYARGNFFPECVTACAKGKLFAMGLAHIERWKQQIKKECDVTRKGKEIEKTKQEFLECYACHYFELKDTKSMMKVVNDFNSMNSIRNFLKLLGCFDELMSLEEKSGNFLEAAEIAKLKGDELLVADLLGKAGNFKEAATLVLSYVLANSLWSSGKKGWPLKLFKRKDSLLTKAKLFARNETVGFYEFVCTEADIMENKKSDLLTKQSQLNASQRHQSLGGEILSVRKILDDHLASNFMKYFFEEHLVLDLVKHSEDMISQNQVSVESLVYFWKFWKEKVFGIFEYLARLETQDVREFESYGEFCLSFLGVRKKLHNQNLIYILLNPDADWTRNMEKESVGLGSDGNKVSVDVCQFVSAAQIYWSSEVLSVGFMVLHKLEALYNFVTKKSDIIFKKCRNLTLIYEVAECLLDSKFLKRTREESEDLQKFIKLSTDDFCSHIFPLDWRKPLIEDLTLFKETDFCKNFLKQVIVEYTNPRDNLSPGKIGSIAMVILGSGKLNYELLKKILERMDRNPQWKAFFEILSRSGGSCFPSHSLICRFHEALVDAYNVNDRTVFDCISPGCFLYLVDRLLIWASSFQGYFITTKASFVEWLIHQEIPINNTWSSSNATVDFQLSLPTVLQFVISVIRKCLCNKGYLIKWIKKYSSSVNENYSVIVCRMVMIICLLHANFRMGLDLLFDLLGKSYIIEQLPSVFTDALKSHFLSLNLNVLAEAFKKIDNLLVIVSFGPKWSTYSFPSAIVFDMEVYRCKIDIMRRLFLKSCEASDSLSRAAAVRDGDSAREIVSTTSTTTGNSSDVLHSNCELGAEQDNRNQNKHESNLLMDYASFWEIFEGLNSQESGRDERKFTSNAQTIKVDVVKYIRLLTAATKGSLQTKLGCEEKSSREDVVNLVDELKQLSAALDARNISLVKELSKKLQARRPRMEHVLEQLFLQHETDQDITTLKEVAASSDRCDKEDISAMSEKISDSNKFQSKVTRASVVLENEAKVAELKTKEGGSCHIL